MKLWTFMEYVSFGGRGEIAEWCKDLDDEEQEEFYGILRGLEVLPRDLWTRPDYSPLEDGISEIRFKGKNKIQYRPLGFFLIEDRVEAGKAVKIRQYVLLVGAFKKMNVWTPKDAKKTAKKRRKLVLEDRSRIRKYDEYSFQNVPEDKR